MDKIQNIEEIIKQKAIKRFKKDYQEMLEICSKHPILKELTIKIPIGDKIDMKPIFRNSSANWCVFDLPWGIDLEKLDNYKITNIDYIKNTLLAKYIEEESNNFITKLNELEQYIQHTDD
jgi:hypothetical protein